MKTTFFIVLFCFLRANNTFAQTTIDAKTQSEFAYSSNKKSPIIAPDKWVAENLTKLIASCIATAQRATIYKTHPLWIDPKEKIVRFDGFKIIEQTAINDSELQLLKSIICDSSSYINKADLVKFCLFTPTLGIELHNANNKKSLNILLARSCSMIQFHLDSTTVLLHCDPSTPRFEPFFTKLEKMAAIAAASGTANTFTDLASLKTVEKTTATVSNISKTPPPPVPIISNIPKTTATISETSYEVTEGDNLTRVARNLSEKYHITVVYSDLLRWNPAIRSKKRKTNTEVFIAIGQKLTINIDELYKLSTNPY